MDDNQLTKKLVMKIVDIIQDPSKVKVRITISIIVLIISLFLYYLLKKWSYKQNSEIKKKHIQFLIFKYLIIFCFILSLFVIWLNMHGALMSIIGIGALVLLLLVKGSVSNIIGGILILNKSYFKIYDRIEIDGIKGTVISVRLFYFTVIERGNWFTESAPTGRTIKIPNATVLTNNVINYNGINTFTFKEVKYSLTFESNWEKAQQIVKQIVEDYLVTFEEKYLKDEQSKAKLLKELEIYECTLKPKKVVRVTQEDIEIKFRFIVYYTQGSPTTTIINEKVLRAFSKEDDIELAGRLVHIKYDE